MERIILICFISLLLFTSLGCQNQTANDNDAINSSETVLQKQEEKSISQEEPIITTEEKENLSDSEIITSIVKKIDDFDIMIVDTNGEFYIDSPVPPYEIIINSTPEQIIDCFDAKNKLVELMKGLYKNDKVGNKISRVKFSAWGQLRASLGSDDSNALDSDPGPSVYWENTLKFKPYEDEDGPLEQRTWGVSINGCK